MRGDELVVEQRPQVVFREPLDGAQLVGGAEPVEEVDEGDPRAESGACATSARSLGLLHGRGGEKREPRRAGGHHVGVVSEDRQRVRRDGAAATWKTAGVSSPAILNMLGSIRRSPCELVNVVARTRPGGRRAPPGSAAFALHLDHTGHGAPWFGTPCDDHASASSPIGVAGDRVDRDDLARAVRGPVPPVPVDDRAASH